MMEFLTWLRSWLTRHPLKEPAETERASYTVEVMTRVRALGSPSVVTPATVPVRRWSWWPRMAMAMATAAGLVFAVSTVHQTRRRLAQQPQGAAASHPSAVLAESPVSDEEWIEQTLQLLEELEEETAPETAGDGSNDEEWLDELQWLDESELST
jgi:hypothetical protein